MVIPLAKQGESIYDVGLQGKANLHKHPFYKDGLGSTDFPWILDFLMDSTTQDKVSNTQPLQPAPTWIQDFLGGPLDPDVDPSEVKIVTGDPASL